MNAPTSSELAAQIEPFDSFWEGPEDIERGYDRFFAFYRHNYVKHFPEDRNVRILVVSCGPGYMVHTLNREGYQDVLGIDSFAEKIQHARQHGLNCRTERAFEFLDANKEAFDVIFCEQEINHLTKKEIPVFLRLCQESLRPQGSLVIHALNGANPITGAEALAQNYDHYNTFTEYTMRQVLGFNGFTEIRVIPLNLYVFFKNPLNYVLIVAAGTLHLFFRAAFILYGKSNRIFTKKIAAVCRRP